MIKFVWLTGLVAVVVLAGFVHLTMNQASTPTQSTAAVIEPASTTTTDGTPILPFSGQGSLISLLDRSAPLECRLTFDLNEGGVAQVIEGTLFTDRDRLRSDVVIDTMGQTGVASVIVQAGEVYSWTDFAGQKNGVKAKQTNQSSSSSHSGAGPLSVEQIVNYDCQAWTSVDASVFEVPTDIIFSDLSTSTTPVMEDGTVFESPLGTSDPCEVCRLVPDGPSQTECLKNFSCQ